MSVFKNFTRVLSQSTLNSGNRTYILSLKNSIHNPALFTLSPGAPPQDIFQLSLAAYHLVRKGEIGRNLLHQIEGESAKNNTYADAQQRLQKDYDDNQKLAGEYTEELRRVLRSGVTTLPVHNAIHALYALEATSNGDAALYEEFLFPVIKEKIQHASLNNLIELTGILSTGKHYKDTALWSSVLKQLDTKFDRPGPKYVTYSGWSLDSYELEAVEEGQDQHETEFERYWADRKDGSSHYANLRSELRVAYDKIKGSFLNRILQRETRIANSLDNFKERLEREKLRKSLEGARSAGINVDAVIGRLRS